MNRSDESPFPRDSSTDKREPPAVDMGEEWKILVVDDEEEVHAVTNLVFKRFSFEGMPFRLYNAGSAAEAKEILRANPDIATILLDVVMEEEDSGLKLAKYIREDLKNSMVRIILRTGYPGRAPEQDVIINYDINDYKEKTELTEMRLKTSVVSSLRAYRDLMIIDANRRGLRKIIEGSAGLFEIQSIRRFATGVLTQLTALLHMRKDAACMQVSGFTAVKHGVEDFQVFAATGSFEPHIGKTLSAFMTPELKSDCELALKEKRNLYYPDRLVVYSQTKNGTEDFIYISSPNGISERERDLIDVFAMNVAVAFDNINLTDEIEATQKEIIFTLGEVAEARSMETGFHVKRVAELSKFIALKLGLPEEEAELLRLASPTHDIGKLAIPDSILNKPGKLTADEFATMKTHAEIGWGMLKKSSRAILQTGSLIAHQHHEHFDGSGYPLGLKDGEIHIYSRIVALADVFDALSNERVYKTAWATSDILEYMKEHSGTMFDPEIVEIFLANIDELASIRATFPDPK